jgi:hypothetical protein
MLKKYQGKLYCFSPPVMLATFLFEFGFAFYTVWRYKMTTVTRLAFVTLISLGTFQLAEYMVCGGLGWTHIEWARLGYVAITLLPALGIHMVVALAGKKAPALISAAYASCAAFLVFYVFAEGAMDAQACYPNYAVFYTHSSISWLYGYYYYGWLLVGTFLAARWGHQAPKRKKALYGMVAGYMVFILPTTAFNLIDPSTTQAIPSIMCGFAVLFAFTLVIRVLPSSVKVRASSFDLIKKLQSRI